MSYLLMISNTPSENTLSLSEAVVKGAKTTNFPINVVEPLNAVPEDVLGASGVILGTTENFGYMSGQLKDFFERIYYPCLEKTQGLPWALYVSAGQDGTGAVSSVERIVNGLKWRKIQNAMILKAPFDDSYIKQCEELGECMTTGLEAKVF